MKPVPRIRAASRPTRVAYLIEDGPDSHGWLDSIFAACFSRYGGRQSLVVPVADGAIPERYKDWLRLLDPDVAFVLTYDNSGITPHLTGLLADTMILHRDRRRDVPEDHPRVDLGATALTALSWLPFLKVSSGAFRGAPEFILDSYPVWRGHGLVTDNFGVLS